MITLEYFYGESWGTCGLFHCDDFAWISLNGDTRNYRTVNREGVVLTDKSFKAKGETQHPKEKGR